MKKTPKGLPLVPEGWVYIGCDNGNLISDEFSGNDLMYMCEKRVKEVRGEWFFGNEKDFYFADWNIKGRQPEWHAIAKEGSRLAALNGAGSAKKKTKASFEDWWATTEYSKFTLPLMAETFKEVAKKAWDAKH